PCPHRSLLSFPTRRSSDLWSSFSNRQRVEVEVNQFEEFDVGLTLFGIDGIVFSRDFADYAKRMPKSWHKVFENDEGIIFHRKGPDRKSTRLNSSHVKISYA